MPIVSDVGIRTMIVIRFTFDCYNLMSKCEWLYFPCLGLSFISLGVDHTRVDQSQYSSSLMQSSNKQTKQCFIKLGKLMFGPRPEVH